MADLRHAGRAKPRGRWGRARTRAAVGTRGGRGWIGATGRMAGRVQPQTSLTSDPLLHLLALFMMARKRESSSGNDLTSGTRIPAGSAKQLPLPLREATGWGGKRKGAGRKKQPGSGLPHRVRPRLASRFPVHVTMKVVSDLPNLRAKPQLRVIEGAFRAALGRHGLNLAHYSIQKNHLHLIAEAKDRDVLRCRPRESPRSASHEPGSCKRAGSSEGSCVPTKSRDAELREDGGRARHRLRRSGAASRRTTDHRGSHPGPQGVAVVRARLRCVPRAGRSPRGRAAGRRGAAARSAARAGARPGGRGTRD